MMLPSWHIFIDLVTYEKLQSLTELLTLRKKFHHIISFTTHGCPYQLIKIGVSYQIITRYRS